MQSNVKGFFYGIIVTGGLTAVVLLFAMQGREEVKVEQKIQRIEKRIDDKTFDAEFANRWEGKKVGHRNNDTASDEKELAELKAQQREIEASNSETVADFKDAMAQAGGQGEAQVPSKK